MGITMIQRPVRRCKRSYACFPLFTVLSLLVISCHSQPTCDTQ